MFAMRLTVGEFIDGASSLWKDMQGGYKAAFGCRAGESEVNSWRNSYPALAEVLAAAPAVRVCQIFLEYGMPSSFCRADALIAGLDAKGYRSAVVVELKQWEARSVLADGHNLKVGGETHLHPSEQALGYRDYLADLSEAFVDTPCSLRSCAYLHNTTSAAARHLIVRPFDKLTELSPLFTSDLKSEMGGWLAQVLVDRPDSRYLTELESGIAKVSKNLFDTVARAVRDEPAWTLLDEQRAAYNQIRDLVDRNDGEPHVVLVSGGPGTGKSVIAMQLMGELSRRNIPTVHVTNSKSFTTVMQSLIQQKGNRVWGTSAVAGLFRLSHSWVKRKDRFDVTICDEAHRFRRSTNLFPYLVSRRPQAEEILENTRVLVAFLDEKQILRRAEEGTVDYFRQCAAAVGIRPENVHGPIELTAQFRCAGSNEFIRALDSALYEGKPLGFSHENFEVTVQDSPEAMEEYLQENIRNGYTARVVAGFCWEWSDPKKDGSLVDDVRLGSWSRAWNRKATRSSYPPGEHPYTLWANRKVGQLEEVGCIYSAQGFEFDYVGVIWGKDLVRRGDEWVAHPEESFDSELQPRGRAIDPAEALPLLKNAYRVLCSRGMRGCSIYCEDEETRGYIRKALTQ